MSEKHNLELEVGRVGDYYIYLMEHSIKMTKGKEAIYYISWRKNITIF